MYLQHLITGTCDPAEGGCGASYTFYIYECSKCGWVGTSAARCSNGCFSLSADTHPRTTCGSCGGTGSVTGSTSCTTCGGDGKVTGYANCTVCGADGKVSGTSSCGTCAGDGQISCTNSSCNEGTITTTLTCTESGCNEGTVTIACSHGYYEAHYYCEHNNNTTNTTHYYCEHNTNGEQHEIDGILSTNTVTADTTAPTITSVTGNPTEWTYENVTLTINGANDTGVGLAEKPYSFDGGATWQAEASKTYEKNTSGIVIQVKDSLGNTYTHETINITKIKLLATKIEITTMPETEYESGEDFDSNGMVVTVTYSDGSSEATTDYTVINGNDLTCLVEEIEIQYNEDTEIKTKIAITVGHDMQEATCTEAAKCKIEGCNYTEGEALGHNYESEVTEPTCTEKGYTTHKCTRCNDEYVDTYTDERGHSFTNYESDNNATCTEDGTETATCDREGCDETHTRVDEGSKLPHNYEDGECTDCGEEEPGVTIESTEYTVLEAYITKIPDRTTFEEFKENIETNAEEIKVYNKDNQELTEEDLVATGMTLTLRLGSETRTFKLVVVGDTTGDGIADFKDVVSINTHRLHKTTLSGEYLMAGDVTEDNGVDFKDIVKINRYRLSKILQLFKIL